MEDLPINDQEPILKLTRSEALSRKMTIDLSIPNTKTSKICRKYFGPNALVSISKTANGVLSEVLADSDGLLKFEYLIQGLCIAAMHSAIKQDQPEIFSNRVKDYLFPFRVYTKKLDTFEFHFRCVTSFEENYRKKVITILKLGGR